MRPVLLHLDDALAGQQELARLCAGRDGITIDAAALGPRLRLWSRPEALADLNARLTAALPARAGRAFVYAGSGDFHHVSALLIARTMARSGRPLTVVHIDNHPDWVKFSRGLHCGSWAAAAARMAGVERVVTIGVCSADIRQAWRKGADLDLLRSGRIALFPLGRSPDDAPFVAAGVSRPTMATLGPRFADRLLAEIGTRDVYLSIDKDVLDPADAATNWDQGRMRLTELTALIERLGAAHDIVGGDVCGDVSTPVYGGSLPARLLKRGESLLDQPRRRPAGREAQALNERANLRIFDSVMAVAA